MEHRWQYQQALEHLDPVRDNTRIWRYLAGYEFPWDLTRSLELALFRTFCIPSVAALLDRTGEFHHRPQKRYDDTGLMVSLILKWGHDSPQGQAVIARLNHIHDHFPISNEDFLYVLSTFIYQPVDWLARFGWRPLSPLEKTALFHFWRCVGEQMGITAIPDSYDRFAQFHQAYEAAHLGYSAANQRVGQSTLRLFLSWFPLPLRPLVKPLVYAIMDDGMLGAFGFPQPHPWQRSLVTQTLRWRSYLLRYLPPRQTPYFYSEEPQRSYPQGYHLSDLGPPGLLSQLNQSTKS